MNHVVLLGDSIFDNGAYVGGGPDVVRQLRERLPDGWRASLLAVDGAVTGGVRRQLERIPAEASRLVVSVGGNDVLGEAGILNQDARSVADAMDRLAEVRDRFEHDYRAMLEALLEAGLPTALCTIYEGRIPDLRRRRPAVTALTIFNDLITRLAFAHDLPLIDLRLVCDRDEDYANPIEPSVRGGEKIATAIASLVLEHDFHNGRSTIYTR